MAIQRRLNPDIPAAESTQPSSISMGQQQMSEAIGRLGELAGALEGRLEKVLSPQVPTENCGVEPPKPINSPLGDWLDEQTSLLRLIADKMHTIIQRCEL